MILITKKQEVNRDVIIIPMGEELPIEFNNAISYKNCHLRNLNVLY